ncbi:MAG: hypothetical protein DRP26_02320 [Candidatus Zixiibacteriota bacterium]|nr:MAG: hypothetical protein DRP26_02320 [candidate division Zixibacteria bacterium]
MQRKVQVMGISNYEKKVKKEIIKWQNEKEGVLAKIFNFITTPIEWTVNKVVPDAVIKTVNKAVLGFMEMLKDVAFWTFSDRDIIKEAQKSGIEITKITELEGYNLEKLDKIAHKYFTSNKIIAALEGGGCGLGGFALIAADIPVLFTINFRVIQQIGSCYGFDMKDPKISMVVMGIFGVGSTTSAAAKAAALVDMHITVEALAKGWTYKKIAETTQSGTIIKAIKSFSQQLPKKIANNITKRKLAQLIPFFGAVAGAGFNYWFTSNVAKSAYMIFRELYLKRKHDDNFPSSMLPVK